MAFRIRANEPVADAVRRIAQEQVDRAIAEIDNKRLARNETLHQVRKRCKKVRALARLVRPVFGKRYEFENAFFRDTADALSGLRDAQILLETYDALFLTGNGVDRRHFASLRRRLARRKTDVARDTATQDERLGAVRKRFCDARERIASWNLEEDGFDAIEGGLLKTYSRGAKAMQSAYEQSGATAFHEWRKHISYHRYHVRLLRNLWQPVFQSLRHELETLAKLLGNDHDLAVLRGALTDKAAGFERGQELRPLLDLIDRRSAELRAKARLLGERIYAEKPKLLAKRFRHFWTILRNDGNSS